MLKNKLTAGLLLGSLLALSLNPAAHAVLRFNEDSAHTSGDQGVMVLTERLDTPASSAGTTGDYAAIISDSKGRVIVNLLPNAIDGTSMASVLSATATGTTTVTAQANLLTVIGSAQHATTDFWLKIYDKATAATDADTPKLRIFMNAQSTNVLNLGPYGAQFANGISIRCVTEAADNGTTAAGSNECTANIIYK